MLHITVPAQEAQECFDEEKGEFFTTKAKKAVNLSMEHSLVSIAKWEAIWKKPFLVIQERTPEETLSYIKCMTLTQNVPDEVFLRLSDETLKEIEEYWADPYTATTFTEKPSDAKGDRNILTAEVIY